MENLTKKEKQYLEKKLSAIFHESGTRIKYMKMIISILGKLGIDTKDNYMQYDLSFCEGDLEEKITNALNK